jgi:lycopene elongase/hydratase (dihydrobisanhydrobacterioruberin-forming)
VANELRLRARLERLLPPGWLPYLLHLRPRAWPIVAAHMSVGVLLAIGPAFTTESLRRWLLGAVVWGILGNGGTLAINSVFDRDEGDIGYLDNPPPVPRHLLAFSLAFLIAGWALAATLGGMFLAAYSLCLAMSLLYSVPPIRAKARAGFDVLINSAGFGGLTVFAGWAALGRPVTSPIVAVAIGFFFLFAGFYPLTQIYQMAEDRSRGDSTLALALGKRNAILFSLGAVSLASVLFLGEAWAHFRTWRSILLVAALALWYVLLLGWLRRSTTAERAHEQRGFYTALWIWALTDVAIVVAMTPVF